LKLRTLALASVLMVGLLAASVVPAGMAGAVWAPQQTAATPTARLVSVRYFTFNDGPAPAGRDALRQPGTLNAAGCSNPGPGTGAYNLSGTRVTSSTTAHFNVSTTPAGVGSAASSFQAAFNTWKAAEPAAPSISVATDGTSRRPTANHRYDLMFSRLGGRTLAITYSWRWSTGEYENDTAFNKAVSWFQAPGEGDGCYETARRFDLQNTATHEFGHTYGLSHVSSAFNTMAPSATLGETYKRSLASGDIAGIRAIY
jgi:hypothetical protein